MSEQDKKEEYAKKALEKADKLFDQGSVEWRLAVEEILFKLIQWPDSMSTTSTPEAVAIQQEVDLVREQLAAKERLWDIERNLLELALDMALDGHEYGNLKRRINLLLNQLQGKESI